MRSLCTDVAFDPGRATPPRIAAPHMLPSNKNAAPRGSIPHPAQSLCTLRNRCRQRPRNTRYQADATPELGRTCTGWIAPACGCRTYSVTSLARASRVGGNSRRRFSVALGAYLLAGDCAVDDHLQGPAPTAISCLYALDAFGPSLEQGGTCGPRHAGGLTQPAPPRSPRLCVRLSRSGLS
jgi:hypothetical protein